MKSVIKLFSVLFLVGGVAFVLIFSACKKNDVNTLKSSDTDFSKRPYTYLQNKYIDLVLAYEFGKQGIQYYPDGYSLEAKLGMINQLDVAKTENATDETAEDVGFYENLQRNLMDEINSHPYIQAFIAEFALTENYDAGDMIVYTGYSDCFDGISKFQILKYYEDGIDLIGYYRTRNSVTGEEEWNPFPAENPTQKAVRHTLTALWGKTIEYMWNGVNSTVKAYTLQAMADWKAAANNKITFSEITKNVNWNKTLWCIGCKYFIRISQNTNSDNWSSMGKVPYAFINYYINASYPRNYGHELGHNLGLNHEHQRPDRDNYITYYPNNVTSGNAIQFSKMTAGSYNYYNSTFDFNSIMLYGSWAFAKNPTGKPVDATLLKKDGTSFSPPTNISITDQYVIRQMYP